MEETDSEEETGGGSGGKFGWLLGEAFSAVDISLSVSLNRLAQLGLQRLWVNCEERRPRVEAHLREAQRRPAFARAVPEMGLADGKPTVPVDSAVAMTESGAGAPPSGGPVEGLKKEMGNGDSIDVWRELKRGISVKEEEEDDEEVGVVDE